MRGVEGKTESEFEVYKPPTILYFGLGVLFLIVVTFILTENLKIALGLGFGITVLALLAKLEPEKT